MPAYLDDDTTFFGPCPIRSTGISYNEAYYSQQTIYGPVPYPAQTSLTQQPVQLMPPMTPASSSTTSSSSSSSPGSGSGSAPAPAAPSERHPYDPSDIVALNAGLTDGDTINYANRLGRLYGREIWTLMDEFQGLQMKPNAECSYCLEPFDRGDHAMTVEGEREFHNFIKAHFKVHTDPLREPDARKQVIRDIKIDAGFKVLCRGCRKLVSRYDGVHWCGENGDKRSTAKREKDLAGRL
jgi:hypothetical protein